MCDFQNEEKPLHHDDILVYSTIQSHRYRHTIISWSSAKMNGYQNVPLCIRHGSGHSYTWPLVPIYVHPSAVCIRNRLVRPMYCLPGCPVWCCTTFLYCTVSRVCLTGSVAFMLWLTVHIEWTLYYAFPTGVVNLCWR